MNKEFFAAPFLPPEDFSEDFWTLIKREERPIVLYGMGNGADKLIKRLADLGKEVSDFFASDGFVRGQSFHGKTVLSLADICGKYEDFVILVSFGSHLSTVVDFVYGLSRRYSLYIPDMPLAEEIYFDAAFYREHYADIVRAYALLEDEASKRVFAAAVWYKLTAAPAWLSSSVYDTDEKTLCGFPSMKAAVDVGAYRGDTLKELMALAPQLNTVYAVEPDEKNFKRLESAAASYADRASIYCIHAAAWCEDGELLLDASGNRNTSLATREANSASYKHKTKLVKTSKIDTITQGRQRIDYIKYDTEGVEREALLGSAETIKSSMPTLLVSAYHKSEDVFSLILLLEKMAPSGYRFYLRRRNCIPLWDLNLIAIERKEKNA